MINITQHAEVTRFDLARTMLGRGRYWTSAYLVDGMLVDTGCAHTAPELLKILHGVFLFKAINTHTHEDHIGGNEPLQRQYEGLEIFAHPLALPILADPRGMQPLQLYRQLFWGWPEPSQAQPLENGEVIETERYRFRVIYTPGHSPDHLCLYEVHQGWIFSGDLFVGGKDRAIRADCDVWQIIASLKRIAELPANWLFPGSARVRQHPTQELMQKIAYLEELGGQVLDLHQRGWEVSDIVRTLFKGPMFIEWVTLGEFSRRRLVLSYLRKDDIP
jgi:glyoxylase-like metal-dependent hydrolase (beta-lactamase superfamily II)